MNLNKILSVSALILAVFAAFIGSPHHSEINVNEIAALIETEKDHITPIELAENIIAGKKIRLIDLRDSTEYSQEHIAHAERMSLQTLVNGGIKRNEIVVIYSEGGIHASQAWILLKTQRYDSVYTLLGGFAGWKEEILHPTIRSSTTEEEKKYFERKKTASLFFGGAPKIIYEESVKRNFSPKTDPQQKQIPPIKFQKEEEKLRDQC